MVLIVIVFSNISKFHKLQRTGVTKIFAWQNNYGLFMFSIQLTLHWWFASALDRVKVTIGGGKKDGGMI